MVRSLGKISSQTHEDGHMGVDGDIDGSKGCHYWVSLLIEAEGKRLSIWAAMLRALGQKVGGRCE